MFSNHIWTLMTEKYTCWTVVRAQEARKAARRIACESEKDLECISKKPGTALLGLLVPTAGERTLESYLTKRSRSNRVVQGGHTDDR